MDCWPGTPPTPSTRGRAGWLRRVPPWLAVFACIVVVYTACFSRQESDSYYSYATTSAILHDHTLDLSGLDLPHDYRIVPRNGKRLNYFTWSTALFAMPLVIAVDVPHTLGIGPGSAGMPWEGVILSEQIAGSMLAAGAAVLVGLAGGLLLADPRRRFRTGLVVALLFAFATSAWSTASRSLDEHGPSILLLALALYCLMRLERGGPRAFALAAGASLAAAFTVRPSDAIVIALVGIWLLGWHARSLLAYVAGGAAVAVPWFAVTRVEYGAWLQPYFSSNRLEIHPAYADALVGNLVSPARGLLVYTLAVVALAAVGTALALRGRDYSLSTRVLVGLLAGGVVLTWVAVSAFPHWWAGFSYGPRFLTDAGVLLAFLGAAAVDRVLGIRWNAVGVAGRIAVVVLGATVAWSVFVHGEAAVFSEANCWNNHPSVDTHPGRIWDWSHPQFLAGVRSIGYVRLTEFVAGRCYHRHRG